MGPARRSLVARVDHVGVALTGAQQAFGVLRDGFGLPEAWPFRRYGTVRSGGVVLGSLNLEVLEDGDLGLRARTPAAATLLALEPASHDIDALVEALLERGVDHLGPVVTGGAADGFTNLVLTTLGVELGLLCSYHDQRARDVAARRAALEAARGGAVGLVDVTAVAVGAATDDATRLLGPPDGDGWRFDAGPALVVDHGMAAGAVRMTWRVRDAAAAIEASRAEGVAGAPDLVRLPALGGLEVRFVEG